MTNDKLLELVEQIDKLYSDKDKPLKIQHVYNLLNYSINEDTSVSYQIKVEFSTGDSFSTYDDEETIDYIWHSIDIVREIIKRINEQIKYYDIKNGYCREDEISDEEILKLPWAINEKDVMNWHSDGVCWFSIKLLKDNEEEFRVSVPWLGYFESSQCVSIITIDNKK